jgi:3-oxoacyl-[acyl-carrier-protein] synthase-1
MSTPHPDGIGAELAINQALQDANLRAEDIDYINLHGTGTQTNDQAEGRVVSRLFPSQPLCSSTKGMTGHLLGASGATEAAFCWLALKNASDVVQIPPHRWDGIQDSNLPKLNLAEKGATIPCLEQVNFASTSFAFGGNNCCLIFGRNFNSGSSNAAC